MAAPLTGVRVVEVGNYMAAPFCTMQLADLGAEVIKVEHPDGGDQVRHSAPLIDGEGSAFMRLNRNKRSMALDLKTEKGKELQAKVDKILDAKQLTRMKELALQQRGAAALEDDEIVDALCGSLLQSLVVVRRIV